MFPLGSASDHLHSNRSRARLPPTLVCKKISLCWLAFDFPPWRSQWTLVALGHSFQTSLTPNLNQASSIFCCNQLIRRAFNNCIATLSSSGSQHKPTASNLLAKYDCILLIMTLKYLFKFYFIFKTKVYWHSFSVSFSDMYFHAVIWIKQKKKNLYLFNQIVYSNNMQLFYSSTLWHPEPIQVLT
jgi:hypothetical protein